MPYKVNSKCKICGKPIVKGKNTCSCLPCNKKIQDCKNCYNDIFYCFSCKVKMSRDLEMEQILLESRKERIEEIREIDEKLKIYTCEKDIMFQ